MVQDDPAEKPREAFDQAAPGTGDGRVSSAPEPKCTAVSKPPGDVRGRGETARFPVAAFPVPAVRVGNGCPTAGPFDGRPVHASGNRAGSVAGASGTPGTGCALPAGADPDRRRRFGARIAVGDRIDAPGVALTRRSTGGEPEPGPS